MPSQLAGYCHRVWVAAYWWFRTEAFAPFEAVARQPRRIKDLELRFGAFLTPFHAPWPPFSPLLLIFSVCLSHEDFCFRIMRLAKWRAANVPDRGSESGHRITQCVLWRPVFYSSPPNLTGP